MRNRQSSVITETQYPVRSTGAPARGVGGGCDGCPPRPCAPKIPGSRQNTAATASNAQLFTCPRNIRRTLLLLPKLVIDNFDEVIAALSFGGVESVIFEGRVHGYHLLERHIFFHHVPDAVADDGHHVAVVHYVGLIADTSMAGNDPRAAHLIPFGNRNIEDRV